MFDFGINFVNILHPWVSFLLPLKLALIKLPIFVRLDAALPIY